MKFVTFEAWCDSIYLPLAEILLVIREYISDLNWRIEIEEIAPEPGASALEERIENKQIMSTHEVLSYLSPSLQIIDGVLEGFDASNNSVVKIKAVDSMSWDVESVQEEILKILKEKFNGVEVE